METNLRKISVKPDVLYYAFPVLLLTTLDAEGRENLSAASSSWSLDEFICLGFGTQSRTYQNVCATGEIGINIPSADLWRNVEQLARLTGHSDDKVKASELEVFPAAHIRPPLVKECSLNIEAKVKDIHPFPYAPDLASVIVEVVNVQVNEDLLREDGRIDHERVNPIFYNFRHYYSFAGHLGSNFRAW